MVSETTKDLGSIVADLLADAPGEGGRILIDITDLGEFGEAVARHRRQGGAVIINGRLHLGPAGGGQFPVGARVVAEDVVFVALEDSDPHVQDQGGLSLAAAGLGI